MGCNPELIRRWKRFFLKICRGSHSKNAVLLRIQSSCKSVFFSLMLTFGRSRCVVGGWREYLIRHSGISIPVENPAELNLDRFTCVLTRKYPSFNLFVSTSWRWFLNLLSLASWKNLYYCFTISPKPTLRFLFLPRLNCFASSHCASSVLQGIDSFRSRSPPLSEQRLSLPSLPHHKLGGFCFSNYENVCGEA